jgi:hypothetical protein
MQSFAVVFLSPEAMLARIAEKVAMQRRPIHRQLL